MAKTKRWFGFLRNGLRRMSLKHAARNECLKNARRVYVGDNKRQKWEYKCKGCKEYFKATQVQVDHIKPCGELTDVKHIKGFVMRLFCDIEGLQILCSTCHNNKTNEER